MIKNYFKTAWRNLLKNKAHSFLNITGLSVGMAVAMLIGLWIWDELSFDKYHKNYNRIAQVMEQDTYNGDIKTGVAIPLPLDAALRKTYGSDFKHIAMVSWNEQHWLTADDKTISFSGNCMGAEAPELFTLHMLKGSRNGLQGTTSIFLSQSVATALFGNSDPMNKLVKLENNASFIVTGVYEDLPHNTTLRNITYILPWEFYASSKDWVKRATTNWADNSFQMFVQIADNADMAKLSQKIKNIKLDRAGPEIGKTNPQILLHPMSKWHLYREFKNGVNTGGAIEYVWLFGTIGIFVLLLACINFMNLSTARSEKRAKEVGLRKAVGSVRSQLVTQFFCESVAMAIGAFCISLLIAWLLLPFFNEVAGKQMILMWNNPLFWAMSAGFTLFTGLIAGIYPALYLSSFNPVKVLKGTFKAGRLAALPRKALVVVQFTVSVVLIIGTIIVFKQIQFAKNRPVGYSREGMIDIGSTDELHDHFDAIRNELIKSGAIAEMAEAESPATGIHNYRDGVSWKGKDPTAASIFASIRVTTGYGKTIGWQFVQGRDFSAQMLTDSSAAIVNEAAVKYMGLKNPLGEILRLGPNKERVIIGVVKDMVMESPYNPAKQTLFMLGKDDFDALLVKLNPNTGTHEAISKITSVFKNYFPSAPFSFSFVDEDYAQKFINEERIGKLAGFFAALAIFISCLGLFGMATFMAEQRTKEIGIRKVLGASVLNVWGLLSKEFVMLVFISLLIAMPTSYYFMHNWLQDYQYRTDISWWIFIAAGIGAVQITLLTVSFQAVKAAIANPVKSLRTE
jgi:putative ABC transport system permease protein